MRFSILHISDLHRDLRDEVANGPLLESLARDVDRYAEEDPSILRPSICIVTGDLVYGISPNYNDAARELDRQHAQAEDFLASLTDTLFAGNREAVVLLPGNHDVSYPGVIASCERIELPPGANERRRLTEELFAPKSRLRWSWSEYCFYRIIDGPKYEARLSAFANLYQRFYKGVRSFPLEPEKQFAVFDFPQLGLSIAALNSCHSNDPLRRAGGFEASAFSAACKELRQASRGGWLLAAAWHHNIAGGPAQDDYLDTEFLQLLIDSGVSLGFHGHQHTHDCVDERYRLGPQQRKVTLVSAGTLCAEPRNLKAGIPRGYNIVEVDSATWTGRVHSRQMLNSSFALPVWGPGHFVASGRSYVDFEISRPLAKRPKRLDTALTLEQADQFLGNGQWVDAIEILSLIKDVPLARPLLFRALQELQNDQTTISALWPPQSAPEAVLIGGAILNSKDKERGREFLGLEQVAKSPDSSVREISMRISARWFQ